LTRRDEIEYETIWARRDETRTRRDEKLDETRARRGRDCTMMIEGGDDDNIHVDDTRSPTGDHD
jgi:hypothetical protein